MKNNRILKTSKSLKSVKEPKTLDVNSGSIVKYGKIFNNGGSQAIRIPAEYKFDSNVKEVSIEKKDNYIIIKAVQPSYNKLLKSVNNFSDDFMSDRVQPELEKRDLFQ